MKTLVSNLEAFQGLPSLSMLKIKAGKSNSVLRFMVFNATFNNISIISWRSVLLVEETEVTRENHRTVVSH